MQALWKQDEDKRQKLQEKSRQKLEDGQQRQKNILNMMDDQLAKLVAKYNLSDSDTADLSTAQVNYHLMFVMDDSGSMQSHWKDVEKAFSDFIDTRKAKSPNDSVSVILFNSTARLLYSAVPITSSFSLTFNGGGTDFTGAFQTCHKAYQLTKGNEVPTVIFMTDGQANPSQACQILSQLYQSASNCSNTLYTFCIGFVPYDQGTLEQLTKAGNGGTTQRVLNSNTYSCIYSCLNTTQLGEAFNAIGKTCNSLDNIKVLMEAIMQDRKRLAQQFSDANIQFLEAKQREYEAQQKDIERYEKSLKDKVESTSQLIQKQLQGAASQFTNLSNEIDKLASDIAANVAKVKENKILKSATEAKLQGSPEVTQYTYLKSKIESDIELSKAAVGAAQAIGFGVLDKERLEQYFKDAQILSNVPSSLMDVYIMIQSMVTMLDTKMKHIKTLFFDLPLNYIDEQQKMNALLEDVARKYQIDVQQDQTMTLKAIINKIAEKNNYSAEVTQFLAIKFTDIKDLLGSHIFDVPFIDQNTTMEDLLELQNKKDRDEKNFVLGFKQKQIIPQFDRVAGQIMEKVTHKEVELANAKRDLLLLDEYSASYADDKKALQTQCSLIVEQMKELQKATDGNDPESQRIKALVEDVFSAFKQVRKSFVDTLSTIEFEIPKEMLREAYFTIHSFIKSQLELAKKALIDMKSSQKQTNSLKMISQKTSEAMKAIQ